MNKTTFFSIVAALSYLLVVTPRVLDTLFKMQDKHTGKTESLVYSLLTMEYMFLALMFPAVIVFTVIALVWMRLLAKKEYVSSKA